MLEAMLFLFAILVALFLFKKMMGCLAATIGLAMLVVVVYKLYPHFIALVK